MIHSNDSQEGHMTRSPSSIVLVVAIMTATAFVAVPSIDLQAQAASTRPTMTAKLVDPEKNAAERTATVEVTVSGVELIDPAKAREKSVAGQGHLHYQLDKGPVIATPTPKLSFHELTPGAHTIVVMLAGNDHKPLGPQERLTVNIPKAMTAVSKPEGSGVGTSGTQPAAPAPPKKPDY
jgi:hypothetical protein